MKIKTLYMKRPIHSVNSLVGNIFASLQEEAKQQYIETCLHGPIET